MADSLTELLRDALRRRVFAVAYMLPGESRPVAYYASYGYYGGGPEEEGFLYAPFRGGFPRLLRPSGYRSAPDSIADIALPASTTSVDYERRVAALVAHHAEAGGKTVYARRIAHPTARVDWPAVAQDYFREYPDTFRYFFVTPDAGCWLGASPELLMRRPADSTEMEFMALAGTLRDDLTDWDLKNCEEHDYVTRFIVETLARHGVAATVAPATEVRFGTLRHLCHRITAPYAGSPLPLLLSLSPTPALAGYPRDEAVERIAGIEPPRSLYGGYVGVGGPDGFRSYVNLRCVQFNPSGGYCVYAGGGITGKSVLADEWEEAEAKSATLRRIIAAHTLTTPLPTYTPAP